MYNSKGQKKREYYEELIMIDFKEIIAKEIIKQVRITNK